MIIQVVISDLHSPISTHFLQIHPIIGEGILNQLVHKIKNSMSMTVYAHRNPPHENDEIWRQDFGWGWGMMTA